MAVSVWTRVDVMPDRIRLATASVIGAGAEPARPPPGGDGSTPAAMTASATRRTVSCVGIPYALRTIGLVALATIVASIFATEPRPALSGDGLWVTLSLVAMVAGAAVSL